jgi:hypothetical protein
MGIWRSGAQSEQHRKASERQASAGCRQLSHYPLHPADTPTTRKVAKKDLWSNVNAIHPVQGGSQ